MHKPKDPQQSKRWIQVIDGKPDRWHKRKDGTAVYYTVCCDCGLTHKEEIRNKNKYFLIRVWRDDALTKDHRGKRRIVKK
jgi:hypothetical protein